MVGHPPEHATNTGRLGRSPRPAFPSGSSVGAVENSSLKIPTKHATKNQCWRRISPNFGSYQSLLTSLPAAVIAAIAGKDIIAANLERNHPKFEDGTGSGSSRRRSFDKFHRHSSEGYVNERQGTAEKSNHLYHTSYQYVMYVCMYVIFV